MKNFYIFELHKIIPSPVGTRKAALSCETGSCDNKKTGKIFVQGWFSMQIIPILALRLVQVFIRMICQKPEISVPSTLLPLLKTRQLWVKHWSYWGQYLVNKYWILLLSSSATLCPKSDSPIPELTAHCASMRESRRPARGGGGEFCGWFLKTVFNWFKI